jgi:hypothetical protein
VPGCWLCAYVDDDQLKVIARVAKKIHNTTRRGEMGDRNRIAFNFRLLLKSVDEMMVSIFLLNVRLPFLQHVLLSWMTQWKSTQGVKMKGKMQVAVIIGSLLLLSAGCSSSKLKPTDANFIAGLNAYYANHDECLFSSALRFPYEVSPAPDAKEERKRMDALTDAGLMKREEEKTINVSVYSLTAVVTRAGGRFCYGHRQINSIDSSTPPVNTNGLLETQVTYHYTMMDVPVWVKTPQMQAAFPDMAKALAGAATGTNKLANAGAGWQVPN